MMVTLLVFIVVIGILIVVHELGHFLMAKKIGVRVEKFSVGFGPELWKKKAGDTDYSVSAIPLGGYVKLAGDNPQEFQGKSDEYFSHSPGERALIVFCGPLLNYVLGFLCLWLVFFTGYPMLTTKVGALIEGLGAQQAGILPGDRIAAIDGEKVKFWDDMQQVIRSKKGASVLRVEVVRQGQRRDFEVRLQERELDDRLGQKRRVGLLGVSPEGETVMVRHGAGESFLLGLQRTWELTTVSYRGLWRIITRKLSLRDSVTGPLGIFYITGKAAEIGISAVIQLIAVLSVSLAIFNLLPLPVLDGGHILFLAIEKLRGRRFTVKTEDIISRCGLVLIGSLAIVITYIDVWRIFGPRIAAFFK